MADFLDKMMAGINKGAATIGEGSKNMFEKAKINTAIHEAEKDKAKLAELLGMQAYRLYFSGVELPEELHNFCMEMKKRDDAIEAHQEAIRALETKNTVAAPAIPEAAPSGKTCSCGHVNNLGAAFCAGCGAKLD